MNILIGKKVKVTKDNVSYIGTIVSQSWISATGAIKTADEYGRITCKYNYNVVPSTSYNNVVIDCPKLGITLISPLEEVKFI